MRYEDTDDRFEFSPDFDRQFLWDLYGDDMQAAAEIFLSSLHQAREELARLDTLQQAADVEGIRRLFHKIKPLFGYMGLLAVQDYVQAFEDRCQAPATMDEIRVPLESVRNIVHDALSTLQVEQQRLTEYNNRRA